MVDHLGNPLAQSRAKIFPTIIHQDQLSIPGGQKIPQVQIIGEHQSTIHHPFPLEQAHQLSSQ